MRNLARMTNYANNQQARKDWRAQVNRAFKLGQGNLAAKCAPREDIELLTWHKLDKHTAKLREALDAIDEVSMQGK